MKDVDKTALARVYVSMKVSVLKNAGNDSERDKDIVSHISKYANTQSAVKKSDFNINEPFLVELEQISLFGYIHLPHLTAYRLTPVILCG